MADIAKMCGVSTATVSRALNGSGLISPETRDRILGVARSVNYTVNHGARSLRQQTNRTIGVVIPFNRESRQGIAEPFFLGMLGHLADALTSRQFDLLLSRVDSSQLEELGSLYDTGRVAALVVVGQWEHHDHLNALASRGVPIVVWGAKMGQQFYATVGTDNLQGGMLAAGHLLKGGRRRLIFFGDPNLPEVAQRYQGFLQAHATQGVDLMSSHLAVSSFRPDAAQAAARQLLRSKLKFDGIVASSDLQAINIMGVLGEHGIRIPEDVGLVGYDDVEIASHSFPPLTTIRQPLDLGAERIVDQIEATLAGGKPKAILLPTKLVVRQSSP